ncbi:hypothetical protein [Paenibacillus germinis]|uniref:hypothetical protein n=1 Tax=Paenibacillus germinis TaxID=2654979 RepID=UPI001FE7EB0C|nr:hypothetical protein [Paenibacillus germinis]
MTNIKAISVPLFRETELSVPSKEFWGLKLSPSIWTVILRSLWLSGYSRQCESLSNAKQRAKEASILLVNCAKEQESVALVGHGFFNLLIAKELQKKGWKGKKKTSSKHWNCTTYSLFN